MTKGQKQLSTTGDKNPAKRQEVRAKISLALRGRHLSDEHKRKLSEIAKKRKFSEETRRKMSLAIRGKVVSEETKEKIRRARLGTHRSEETKRKISEANSGINHFNFGKKFSEITRRKISEGLRGKNVGKRRTEEQRKHMSEIERGDKAPNWKGGLSFLPYSVDWNQSLKRTIRERDHYTCQLCGALQGDWIFDVHHIDYDKKNCNPNNLVTLCRSCHTKTGHKREHWKNFLKNKIGGI